MKLLIKTNLINIVLAGVFLMLGGFLIYKLTTSTISEETTEKLIDNKDRIVDRIKNEQPVGSIPPIIEIKKIGHLPPKTLVVNDTILLDPISEDEELFREVTSYETINFQNYRITVRQIILEPHDYINNVQQGLLLAWVFSIVGLMSIYWFISKNIWRPFKKNIAILKNFKVADRDRIQFQRTSTSEFKQLNNAIEELTEKVRSDYRSLKEFTENAAHEIQTPLMIIQTKLEDVLQYPDLDPQVGEKIKTSIESSIRLSKLIQTLLLLAKIENYQFNKKETVDLRICIKNVLVGLEDFISSRKLHVEAQLESISVVTDPLLAEVLITNLMTNAIKYNIQDGSITIELSNKGLRISNPSKDEIENPEMMFDRFAKGSQAASSHGLGLAIVKKICDQQGWKATYSVKDNIHIMQISF